MASVRMNPQLRREINYKGSDLFNDQIRKAKDGLADDFWQRTAEQYAADTYTEAEMARLPEKWIAKCTHYDITIKIPHELQRSLSHQHEGTLIEPIRIPDLRDRVGIYGTRVELRIQHDAGYVWPTEVIDEVTQYLTRVKAAETQQTEFVKKLESYLKKCNTLKQFLNAWPQGEELVPEHDMIRYREPKVIVKTATTRLATERDSTELNAGLLRQKIMRNI